VEFLLSIPISLRLLVLFLFGISIGGQLNRGIYRLAWDARDIGPWTPAPKSLPPRQSISRLPVLGWLWLRYESVYWGRGYWIRPMLVELLTGWG
jgi:leader peptidase (prepilin peptidase)/N-methyltransferase